MSQNQSTEGPDSNGYYNVVLHRFGVPEKSGKTYIWDEQAHEAIKAISERADGGMLYAEYGMPDDRNIASDTERFKRIAEVHEDRACAYFTGLSIEMENDEILVLGKAKFSGPMGSVARKLVEATSGVPCFGLRGFCRMSTTEEGEVRAHLTKVITFDFIGPDPYTPEGNPTCPTYFPGSLTSQV